MHVSIVTWWSRVVEWNLISSLKAVQNLTICFLHIHTTHCPFPHNYHSPVQSHLDVESSPSLSQTSITRHLRRLRCEVVVLPNAAARPTLSHNWCSCDDVPAGVFERAKISVTHDEDLWRLRSYFIWRIFSASCQISYWMYGELALHLLYSSTA